MLMTIEKTSHSLILSKLLKTQEIKNIRNKFEVFHIVFLAEHAPNTLNRGDSFCDHPSNAFIN